MNGANTWVTNLTGIPAPKSPGPLPIRIYHQIQRKDAGSVTLEQSLISSQVGVSYHTAFLVLELLLHPFRTFAVINRQPAAAGAGILGIAVGFGFQNLVRDNLSGAFSHG